MHAAHCENGSSGGILSQTIQRSIGAATLRRSRVVEDGAFGSKSDVGGVGISPLQSHAFRQGLDNLGNARRALASREKFSSEPISAVWWGSRWTGNGTLCFLNANRFLLRRGGGLVAESKRLRRSCSGPMSVSSNINALRLGRRRRMECWLMVSSPEYAPYCSVALCSDAKVGVIC